MKVIDLIHKANPAEVARIYDEQYSEKDGWGTVEPFLKFRDILTNTVGINGGDDQFKVVVQWIDQKWGGPNDDLYHDQYFCVSGRMIRDPETSYSLSMTDWGEWREMEVEDESEKNLSIDELAAHVYYEITWFGWPESMEKTRDKINDQYESYQRAFDGWEKGDPLPPGYKDLSEFLDEFQKDVDDGDDSD